MVNIIKNIDPPIDLTQSIYNSLSTEQKNGGNVFYVEDGTQINQNASILETNNSNVQTQLNTFNNNINDILTGQQYVHSASHISTVADRGYQTDQYGNFIHKTATSTNSFTILPYAGNPQTGSQYYPLRVYYQTGQIRCKHQKDLVIGKGQSVTFSQVRCTGALVSNGSAFYFTIPAITAATSATVTAINGLYIPNNLGDYCYMKYGTNAANSIRLSNIEIWKNSAEAYANSINSVAISVYSQQITIVIHFKNRLVTTSAGTTNMANNVPVFTLANITVQFN